MARVLRAPRRVALLFAAGSVLVLALSAPRLGINSSEDALFEPNAHHAQLRDRLKAAFPALVDPLLVVVDGATIDAARDAAADLQARLRAEPEHFPTVFAPGSSPFFETHALLYLDEDELEALVDRLAELQPFIGALAADPSLRGLCDLLAEVSEAAGRGELESAELGSFLEEAAKTVHAVAEGQPASLSWAEILLGHPTTARELRRLVVVEPVVDYAAVEPAGPSLDRLREIVAAVGAQRPDVRLRVTGLFALSQEESQYVTAQASVAGAAAFALVSVVLGLGLRSARLVFCILGTLLAGLALTAGFAATAVGHLNLISVAFAVLFVGLGVDFGVHLGVRYRTRLGHGATREAALRDASREVGGSLAICSATTAIAFYAFVPTGFVGIAELGLIAGTGMFISLFASLTLLPALLALGREPEPPAPRPPLPAPLAALLELPVRHARPVAVGAVLLTLAALPTLPSVEFDPNPLRVRDPNTESVKTYEDLLEDGMALPWNIHAIADDRAQARELAARLEALPTVKETLTVDDYVPSDQARKLALVEDAAFLLLPSLSPSRTEPPPSPAEQRAALAALEESLGTLVGDGAPAGLAAPARDLHAALAEFRSGLDGNAPDELARLEQSLLRSLPTQLRLLRDALQARGVSSDDLPEDLRRQLVTPDGRVRIEITPSGDLNDNQALERYTESVGEVAPRAYGEALAILEIEDIVVRAFRQALLTAAVAIVLVLYALWRNWTDTALVALPLALAALYTAAGSVVAGVPFNFANVIVIPLLLGMGVDSGIHLVHRLRYEDVPHANLLRTDTARAVIVSGLTTIASFAALGFTSHLGLATLGRLLTLGMVWILLCNLVILPMFVVLAGLGRREA